MTDKFFQILADHIQSQGPNLSNGENILEFLYECYCQYNNLEKAQIKADFEALYEVMNGMTIREMDKVIYPVCSLCRDHERAGFVNGIMVGIRLRDELAK